jgi:quercetin dioxygenase-like cupin family protein
MKVKHFTEVKLDDTNMEGACGTGIRWMLGPDDEMPNFYLRMIEIEPGGNSPRHTHPYEHEVYVLEGKGELVDPGGGPLALRPGDVAYVAPDELHNFRNAGDSVFRFLCIIPKTE